ncbi:hypothetical protein [Streptosporangium sp. NPDC020145]|uniref:hypothetical protein n=1 Tax=Streptosporangium sp. NPDC020145 TaxID=3154694 RepID=UPI00341E2111
MTVAMLVAGMTWAATGAASAQISPTKPPLDPAGTEKDPPFTLGQIIAEYGNTDLCEPGSGPGGPAFNAFGTQPVPLPGQRVVRIVITGDSYMSGEGTSDYYNKKGVVPPPMIPGPNGPVPAPGYSAEDYQTDWRHRSPNAAVMVAIDQLRRANPDVHFDVRFNASSGASSQHYFVRQLDNENRDNPPQQEGITRETDLVIAGFGGNDVQFGPRVQDMLKGGAAQSAIIRNNLPLLDTSRADETEWADSAPPTPPLQRPLTTPSTLSARYVQLVRAMHASGGSKTRVMLVNYPQSVKAGQLPTGVMGRLLNWHNTNLDQLEPLAGQLTASMRKAMQVLVSHGVQADLLDIQNAFAGHELGSRSPYVRNLAIQAGPTTFNRVQQTAHPTRAGAAVLANYYALMIAAEVGVKAVPEAGAPAPDAPARPCQSSTVWEPPDWTPSGGGSTGGGGGGGGGRGGSPWAPTGVVIGTPPSSWLFPGGGNPGNPGNPNPGTPGSGNPTGTDHGTVVVLEPVKTVRPGDPVPDPSLLNPFPTGVPNSGGTTATCQQLLYIPCTPTMVKVPMQ